MFEEPGSKEVFAGELTPRAARTKPGVEKHPSTFIVMGCQWGNGQRAHECRRLRVQHQAGPIVDAVCFSVQLRDPISKLHALLHRCHWGHAWLLPSVQGPKCQPTRQAARHCRVHVVRWGVAVPA